MFRNNNIIIINRIINDVNNLMLYKTGETILT